MDHQRWEELASTAAEALAASQAVADLHTMAQVSHNMAIGLWELGDQAKAFDRARLALNIHQALGDWNMMALSENNLAEMHMRQGNFVDANRHLGQAMDYCQATALPRARSVVLLTMVRYHMHQQNWEQAIPAAEQAAQVAERNQQPLFVARSHHLLGEIAAQQGRHDEADAEFEIAIGILAQADAHERLLECRRAYAKVLQERGDKDQAILQLDTALGGGHSELGSAAEA